MSSFNANKGTATKINVRKYKQRVTVVINK